jgi:hypothetical protein
MKSDFGGNLCSIAVWYGSDGLYPTRGLARIRTRIHDARGGSNEIERVQSPGNPGSPWRVGRILHDRMKDDGRVSPGNGIV